MEHQQILQALRSSELFARLNEQETERVAARVKIRQFFPEEVIVWQGQPSTSLYLVMNGIVAVKRILQERESTLAYLMAGDTFGEVGILENQPRSANVVALTEVDVLVLRREDFLDLLENHAIMAIELARILGRYLMRTNRRLSQETSDTRLVVVLSTSGNLGATSFGTLLAEQLAMRRGSNTVYLEYPDPWRALNGYQLPRNQAVYHHSNGFDILLPHNDRYLPPATRAMLMLEKVLETYENAIMKVDGDLDEVVESFIEHANQVIIMAPPTPEGIRDIEYMQRQVRRRIRTEDTGIFTLFNRSKAIHKDLPSSEIVDADLPYMPDFPAFVLPQRTQETLPVAVQEVLDRCLDRLEQTNSIGIFIPTTVDTNKKTDTQEARDRTMAFMAERFGGATCKPAQGVWLSQQMGLIDEIIYIIQSHSTRQALNHYLDEVIVFVKNLKRDLRQEAMALEINNKLTLI
ncbi:MAG: hypothetical protein OHK0039_19020 [Bacteroidia bacterium]